MKTRVFVSAVLLLTIATAARASCGAASCPLDLRHIEQTAKGSFTLDLSYQYIDQDQPRIGTRIARVGEISGPHHDEVRTLNRITTALLTYAPADRVALSVTVPYVSRDHRHLGSTHAHAEGRLPVAPLHNTLPQSWNLDGLGDVVLEGRYAFGRLWAIAGVKLPTGRHDLANDAGQIGELPIQPGTGTTDGIVGLSYRTSRMFTTATYQFRTGDTGGYRLGNELQISAGGAYPLGSRFEALMQLNSRFHARDRIAGHVAEEAFTGGKVLYASPGVRFSIGSGSVYGIVQVPVYQEVNSLQLTSDANFIVGLQTRF